MFKLLQCANEVHANQLKQTQAILRQKEAEYLHIKQSFQASPDGQVSLYILKETMMFMGNCL